MQRQTNTHERLDSSIRRRQTVAIGIAGALAVGVVTWSVASLPRLTPRAILQGQGDTWPLAFTPDGTAFASSGTSGITLWDTASGRNRTTWPVDDDGTATMGAFSPDAHTFAAITLRRSALRLAIELRDTASGHILWSIPTSCESTYAIRYLDYGKRVRAIVRSGGSDRDQLIDIDAASGHEIARRGFSVPGGGCSAVASEGHLVARGLSSGIVIWNVETNSEHAMIPQPVSGPTFSSCAFSFDDTTLGIGLNDGSIELWDLATRKRRTTVRGHDKGIRSIAIEFSPDGKSLASTGVAGRSILSDLWQFIGYGTGRRDESSEVLMIDVATGRRLGRFKSAIHPSYAPDGRTIAIRDFAMAIELFDVAAPGTEKN